MQLFVPLFGKSGHCAYRIPMELKAIRLLVIENQFTRQLRRKGDIKRRKWNQRNSVAGGWPFEKPFFRVRT